MKMKVVESTMVKPNISTTMSMWISDLDLREPLKFHTQTLYLYRSSGIDGVFFDSAVLKAALSHALAEFYPMAGRLRMSENNRVEIDCNGEGALFVEAEAPGINMDDVFGDDFVPKADVSLIPEVDYSKGISYPLLIVQMNRFKCGGVCLGIGVDHLVCDGISAIHFINTWSEIARGGGVRVPPFFDRTLLRARDVPRPKFPHIEYNLAPSSPPLVQIDNTSNLKFSVFKLTRDQLNALKANCNKLADDRVDYNDDSARTTTMPTKDSYSTFEVVAGHLWRCVTEARGMPENQETKLCMATDGRSRLQPPLPPGYFGNTVFIAVAVASCGEVIKSARPVVARKVQEAIKRMDDEYLRSAIDYIALAEGNANWDGNPYACPNLVISSWGRMPIYDADFGWGKPVYVGLGAATDEGVVHMWHNDVGGLLFAISLPEHQMDIFQKLMYHI